MTKKSTDFIEAMTFEAPGPFEGSFSETPADRTQVGARDASNPYGTPYAKQHYEFFHDVFVIYRPYESCKWCAKAIREGRLQEPEDADYTCPHTRRDAYHALVQRFLKEGYRRVTYKEETLKNGTIQISVSWVVPEKKETRRRAPPDL